MTLATIYSPHCDAHCFSLTFSGIARASAGMELGTSPKEFVLSVSSDRLATAWRRADGGMFVLASWGWAILPSRAGGSNDALSRSST